LALEKQTPGLLSDIVFVILRLAFLTELWLVMNGQMDKQRHMDTVSVLCYIACTVLA